MHVVEICFLSAIYILSTVCRERSQISKYCEMKNSLLSFVITLVFLKNIDGKPLSYANRHNNFGNFSADKLVDEQNLAVSLFFI